MNGTVLLQIIGILAPLSLVSIGGAITVIPEIHRQVVNGYGWVTDAEFAQLLALAQAAPGANILVVSLVGWKVGGFLGGLVALLAICVPSSVLTLAIDRVWNRLSHSPWRRAVQQGLAPIGVGLVLASGAIVSSAVDTSVLAWVVTVGTAAIVLRSRVHPLILMGGAALLALAGWL
jgi:chromate transporter